MPDWMYILFAVLIIGSLVWRYLTVRADKGRIAEYLRTRGATDISISLVWFTHDRDTNTYEVRYTLRGHPRFNSCKIRHWLWSDQDIYWKDPL